VKTSSVLALAMARSGRKFLISKPSNVLARDSV
jgi:hypothetical protein